MSAPSMHQAIKSHLQPLCRVIHRRRLIQYAVMGLIVGSSLAIVCGLVRQSLPWSGLRWLAAGAVVAGLCVGILLALRGKDEWKQAARAVDGHYGWKDSVVTALDLSASVASSPMNRLQVRDALSRLGQVSTRDVLPSFRPQGVAWCAILLVLATALTAAPASFRGQAEPPGEPPLFGAAGNVAPPFPPPTARLVEASLAGYRRHTPAFPPRQGPALQATDPNIVRRFFLQWSPPASDPSEPSARPGQASTDDSTDR